MFQKRYNRMVKAKASIQQLINSNRKFKSIIDFLPAIEEEELPDKPALLYVLSKGYFLEGVGFMMPSTRKVCKGHIPKTFILLDKNDLTLPPTVMDRGMIIGDGGGERFTVNRNGDIISKETIDSTVIIKGGQVISYPNQTLINIKGGKDNEH